jgi:hypothetical protein
MGSMAVNIYLTVLWRVTPCSLVGTDVSEEPVSPVFNLQM